MEKVTISTFKWTQRGGKHWPIGKNGFTILAMTKWSCWAVGIEVFRYGACLFLGPLCIGFGTVTDEDPAHD